MNSISNTLPQDNQTIGQTLFSICQSGVYVGVAAFLIKSPVGFKGGAFLTVLGATAQALTDKICVFVGGRLGLDFTHKAIAEDTLKQKKILDLNEKYKKDYSALNKRTLSKKMTIQFNFKKIKLIRSEAYLPIIEKIKQILTRLEGGLDKTELEKKLQQIDFLRGDEGGKLLEKQKVLFKNLDAKHELELQKLRSEKAGAEKAIGFDEGKCISRTGLNLVVNVVCMAIFMKITMAAALYAGIPALTEIALIKLILVSSLLQKGTESIITGLVSRIFENLGFKNSIVDGYVYF